MRHPKSPTRTINGERKKRQLCLTFVVDQAQKTVMMITSDPPYQSDSVFVPLSKIRERPHPPQ
jgi:hypothetical protein